MERATVVYADFKISYANGMTGKQILIHTIDGKYHVIPKSVFDDVVDGRIKFSEIDDAEMILRTILKEWLSIISD